MICRVKFANNKKVRSASEAHQKTLLLRCYTSAQTKGERIRFLQIVFPLVGHIKMCSKYSLRHILKKVKQIAKKIENL